MTDVVVLGWDGLDLAVAERYGLADAFGAHQSTIDTHSNPAVGLPHTVELWPSMITGLHPDDHGIKAKTESGGVKWGNPVLNAASKHAQGIVPDDLLSYLGAKLREEGFGPDTTPAAYYDEESIATVFDDCGGRAISIPSYQTEYDRRHQLDAHRDQLWQALDCEHVGEGKRPTVDRSEVNALLGREVGARIGHTLGAVQAGEPLVWTWFGLLDSIGHMQPALGDKFVKEWYEVAAQYTEEVRAVVDEETTVIAVSDHGIQDGVHTDYATIASDDPAPVAEIEHVFDIADWLRRQEFASADGVHVDDQEHEAMREELEALGYV